MTSSGDQPPPADDAHGRSGDADPPSSADQISDASTTAAAPDDGSPGDEGLPDYLPLTPELVEEEALRGDFVIRWAVVLFAMLLGFTAIAETPTLVHVKSGQYLAAHGVLPPTTDVFSYTAGERRWVNLSWLFDLAVAGVFAVGDAVGLTVLKAVVAGVIFGLIVHINLNVSTWWGSVCAVLAVLVCHPQFTAQPELVTLLGVALVLWFLHRWRTHGRTRDLWALPAVLLVWANLDPRAFIGGGLLLLYAVGDAVGRWLGSPEAVAPPQRRQLWLAVAAGVVAMLVNPFGWHALLAPSALYSVEYPALQAAVPVSSAGDGLQNFPLTDSRHWEWARLGPQIAALVLLTLFALTALVLNSRRLNVGHVLMTIGALGLAFTAAHEAAAAALVLCVVATLNGQAWYLAGFRQTYSTETGERLFSNGGRAVTVLALAALAFLAAAGRLDRSASRTTGLGWHASLRSAIEGTREAAHDSFDDRPFHFTLAQGDLLIWADRKVFADSRAALFAADDENLLELHDRTRWALRRRTEGRSDSGNAALWRKTFDRFEITHVLPRLYGSSPDYVTYFDLYPLQNEWVLTQLSPAAAVFYRNDLKRADLAEYIAEHRLDFLEAAFREPAEQVSPRTEWPTPPSPYERYLFARPPARPGEAQLAQHYLAHLQIATTGQIPLSQPTAAAVAHLGIQAANRGLAEAPESPGAFATLGSLYVFLGNSLEGIGETGRSQPRPRRYFQAVSAYGQSLLAEPDNPVVLARLLELYFANRKVDLALDVLRRIDESRGGEDAGSPDELAQRAREDELRKQLGDQVEQVAQQIERAVEAQSDRLSIAQSAYQAGCVLAALKVLDDDPAYVAGSPQAQVFRGLLLLESGRPDEAQDALARVEQGGAALPGLAWRSPAALLRLASADYDAAIALWQDERNELEAQQAMAVLQTLPLVASPRLWPVQRIQGTLSAETEIPNQIAELDFNIALCHLESGRPKQAEASLRRVLKVAPEAELRPLVRFYLFTVTGELIDAEPPSDRIPMTPDLFEPEE